MQTHQETRAFQNVNSDLTSDCTSRSQRPLAPSLKRINQLTPLKINALTFKHWSEPKQIQT